MTIAFSIASVLITIRLRERCLTWQHLLACKISPKLMVCSWIPRLIPALLFTVCAAAQTNPANTFQEIADTWVRQQVEFDPTLAYRDGLSIPAHVHFVDNSPRSSDAWAMQEQASLNALLTVDPNQLPATLVAPYASLREQLQSDLQLRVCHTELWNINHFSGWQSTFAQLAEQQPVATAKDRDQALALWSDLPRFLATEMADQKLGLASGYSAPQSVVRRVIAQLSQLADGPPASSPFASPAKRSSDRAFQKNFYVLIANQIDPALRHYREFLAGTYLPHARTSTAISELPKGQACYQAFLRQNTTLTRTPQQVYDLGNQAVAAYTQDILRIGRDHYNTTTLAATLAAASADPASHYTSREDLLAASRATLTHARVLTASRVIDRIPTQPVVIAPLRLFEAAAGAGSRMEANPDATLPAVYRINLNDWKTETRGHGDVVVAHETLPGHHLQIALAREIQPESPLSKILGNAAYAEGWARYAEGMAEEIGILATPDALIERRVWPAHGMVVDPGLNALHWTHQQAIDYLMTTGQYTPQTANDLIDRIAVMPGQLTAYDSGALEIKALRQEAEQQLGSKFRLQAFNYVVLEEGNVPLSELRHHVETWIMANAGSR